MKTKKILILGGSGALGKTLISRYYDHNEIMIFSRDEHKHYYLLKKYPKLKSFIGDIRDKQSVMECILYYRPNIIINAAALKHVPICENNPYESVKTNIIGHQNIIDCTRQFINMPDNTIESLLFISTDKACRPINVYGMCKAISEQLYVNFAKQQTDVKIVIVRYGNVLQSTGSVIPLFKKMIFDGADFLPITHFDMTRFLLTLDQAIDLIEDAYYSAVSHGKIVVPKISSLKIVDIAESLIRNYAKSEIKIKEIGIRPGEKLHEEMISSEEWTKTTEYETHYLIGHEIVSDDMKSYNSFDFLLNHTTAYDFLKNNGVFDD